MRARVNREGDRVFGFVCSCYTHLSQPIEKKLRIGDRWTHVSIHMNVIINWFYLNVLFMKLLYYVSNKSAVLFLRSSLIFLHHSCFDFRSRGSLWSRHRQASAFCLFGLVIFVFQSNKRPPPKLGHLATVFGLIVKRVLPRAYAVCAD